MLNMLQKESIRGFLKTEVCNVEFIKKNGDPRVMHCTLVPEYIPTAVETTHSKPRNVSLDANLVTVWDIDVQDWRSFKLDSVKSFAIDNSTFSVTF